MQSNPDNLSHPDPINIPSRPSLKDPNRAFPSNRPKPAKCIEAVCKGYAQETKLNVKNVALASIQIPATVRPKPNNQPAPAYPFRYITYSVFKQQLSLKAKPDGERPFRDLTIRSGHKLRILAVRRSLCNHRQAMSRAVRSFRAVGPGRAVLTGRVIVATKRPVHTFFELFATAHK